MASDPLKRLDYQLRALARNGPTEFVADLRHTYDELVKERHLLDNATAQHDTTLRAWGKSESLLRQLRDGVETYLRNEPHMSAEHCLSALELELAKVNAELAEPSAYLRENRA